MNDRQRFVASRTSCSYLPEQSSRLVYEDAPDLTTDEYARRLLIGWRRFGTSLFRPRCQTCKACRTLRVDIARFQPDRSQRRVRTRNAGAVGLGIGLPEVSQSKLDLHDRFHAFQADSLNWEQHPTGDAWSYFSTFVDNSIATEEWCYTLDDRLIGVGYVDVLPIGLSAIYYFHDPSERDRSLGTWNILCLIDECRRRGLPHLYLGYFVEGCRSLEYKARFRPNQILDDRGEWVDFRT